MTRISTTLLVLFVLVPGTVGCTSAGVDPSIGTTSAVASARRLYADSLMRGDAAAIANFWTTDAVYMAPGTPTVRGRSTLQSLFTTFFATAREPEVAINSEDLVVSANLAYDVGTYRQVIEARGQPRRTVEGRYLFVWKLTSDGWKIHRGIANTAAP